MPPRIVVFDLGGVLVDLVGIRDMLEWSQEPSVEALWQRWLGDPWVRRFERGHCEADTFARGMVEDWQLPLSPEEFLPIFTEWPRALLPGARELLEETRSAGWRTACLSNSNELHWPRKRGTLGLGALLDVHFLSHEIGSVKPDTEIFHHVTAALDLPPDAILFIDDNQLNVDGARSVGWDAERTVGVSEARRVLVSRGVLPGR